MLERLRNMLIKEFIQVFRDPRMRMVIFVIPCFQMLVIGYAVSTDVKHVRTAVYDLDESRQSRDLVAAFSRSGYFDVVEHIADERRIREILDRGEATAVLRLQHGFAGDLLAGRTAELQVLVDGTDSNTANIVLGYAVKIAQAYSEKMLVRRFERRLGAIRIPGRIELESRAWFNENLESRNFYVPGVLVIIVTLMTLLLTSMSVVREKEIGTMEQIMVTPITPVEFILGKTVPFAIIGYAVVFLVTSIAVFWFEVPMRGNFGTLLFGAGLYILTMLGAGLFISTISGTQQQAMISTFFFFFPAMLLSGFAFPIANMPEPVQWLTLVNPLRYFLIIIRAIFLKGVGLEILWPNFLALGLMAATMLTLSVRRFHKTL
ncbi:MAG: ABC transporter permease [Pirellulales bacterium]|nr:ABC transporter permease [Pirellulales bacterium]